MKTQTQINQEDVIFRSKLPDIYIPTHLPLHSYCFEKIDCFSTRPCLINGATDQIYTYTDVELNSRKVANMFLKLGIKQGDAIMILLHNTPEFVFSFFGASYIGAIATTANPLYTSEEIIKQVKDSNSKIIITESENVLKINEFCQEKDIKILCTNNLEVNGCLNFSKIYQVEISDELSGLIEIDQDSVVALPYTAGTTGIPKGVKLTHKGLVTSVAQHVDGENPNMYIHSDDVLMCVMPLYHIFSLYLAMLCGIRVGAAILLMPTLEIGQFLELVHKYKVTFCPIAPPVVLALCKSHVIDKYDLSSIRSILSGAAPLGKELEDAVKTKFVNAIIGQAYGMTEAAPVITMCLSFAKQPFQMKLGSCGTVARNAFMKIINPLNGYSLSRYQSGEICVKGDQIMKGYLNSPEAIDEDGWLHTGDVGYIDDNDELFVLDRLIELVMYKDSPIAPAELEDLLINHPQISDVVVVPMKDEVVGEVPIAFVVRSSGSTITEDDIKKFVDKQVPFYKRIKYVFFVDSIPKTPSGKILRKNMIERLNLYTSNGGPKGVLIDKEVMVEQETKDDVDDVVDDLVEHGSPKIIHKEDI